MLQFFRRLVLLGIALKYFGLVTSRHVFPPFPTSAIRVTSVDRLTNDHLEINKKKRKKRVRVHEREKEMEIRRYYLVSFIGSSDIEIVYVGKQNKKLICF